MDGSGNLSIRRGRGRRADEVERFDDPFRLAVVGEFNSGKNALINALLGRPGLLTEGVTPTTGTITELWWTDEPESGDRQQRGRPSASAHITGPEDEPRPARRRRGNADVLSLPDGQDTVALNESTVTP
jgi:septin family protein